MKTNQAINVRITFQNTKPPIWRWVVVLSDIILGQLHEAA